MFYVQRHKPSEWLAIAILFLATGYASAQCPVDFELVSIADPSRPSLESNEDAWSKWLAPKLGGVAGFQLFDRTEVDILTPSDAIEVDWIRYNGAQKWKEAHGQALHYASITGRRPVGVYLCRDHVADEPYIYQTVLAHARSGMECLVYDCKRYRWIVGRFVGPQGKCDCGPLCICKRKGSHESHGGCDNGACKTAVLRPPESDCRCRKSTIPSVIQIRAIRPYESEDERPAEKEKDLPARGTTKCSQSGFVRDTSQYFVLVRSPNANGCHRPSKGAEPTIKTSERKDRASSAGVRRKCATKEPPGREHRS